MCFDVDAVLTESAIIKDCVKCLAVPKHRFARLFLMRRKSDNEGRGVEVFEFK